MSSSLSAISYSHVGARINDHGRKLAAVFTAGTMIYIIHHVAKCPFRLRDLVKIALAAHPSVRWGFSTFQNSKKSEILHLRLPLALFRFIWMTNSVSRISNRCIHRRVIQTVTTNLIRKSDNIFILVRQIGVFDLKKLWIHIKLDFVLHSYWQCCPSSHDWTSMAQFTSKDLWSKS